MSETNTDWKQQAQMNIAALNNLYEFIGTQVGPIPAQEHMKECAIDPAVLVGYMIETIQAALAVAKQRIRDDVLEEAALKVLAGKSENGHFPDYDFGMDDAAATIRAMKGE